jgi:hypothetical protein
MKEILGKVVLSFCVGGLLMPGWVKSRAQINIGALAQFKKNQQQELASKLQANAPPNKLSRRGKRLKGQAEMQAAPAKPALIRAQNRVFKTKYSDTRKSVVR